MVKILTVGEPLVRLSTSKMKRLQNSEQFDVMIGGAEYNVAWNLGNLGANVSFASVLPKNQLSKRVSYNLQSVSVEIEHLIFENEGRIGLYFLELGDGLKTSQVFYDRKYSSFSSLKKLPWDFDLLFKEITHLHLTGVTLGLSEFWKTRGPLLLKEAKNRGIFISFDMNYRASMWSVDDARLVYQEIIPYIDALSATYLDAISFFDISKDERNSQIDYIKEVGKKYPNLSYIYGTERHILNPNSYDFRGFLYDNLNKSAYYSKNYKIQSVIDRVGAGDSFASGILDGLMNKCTSQETVDFASAAAVLKHSILGDINLFERTEIERFFQNNISIVR